MSLPRTKEREIGSMSGEKQPSARHQFSFPLNFTKESVDKRSTRDHERLLPRQTLTTHLHFPLNLSRDVRSSLSSLRLSDDEYETLVLDPETGKLGPGLRLERAQRRRLLALQLVCFCPPFIVLLFIIYIMLTLNSKQISD